MTERWAAVTDFVAIDPNGTRSAVRVSIGIPRQASATEWQCPVAIDGLQGDSSISGNDAVQSLGLAFGFVGQFLSSLGKAGWRFEFTDDGVVPLSTHFPRYDASSRGPSNVR
jgi:hypothetical protein